MSGKMAAIVGCINEQFVEPAITDLVVTTEGPSSPSARTRSGRTKLMDSEAVSTGTSLLSSMPPAHRCRESPNSAVASASGSAATPITIDDAIDDVGVVLRRRPLHWEPMRLRRATLAELTDSPASEARRRRDDQFRRALDLAATMPASEAVIIEPIGGERVATLRAALANLLRVEPRDLHWGVRVERILITGARSRRGERMSCRRLHPRGAVPVRATSRADATMTLQEGERAGK
jgi:hypothetical protein